ncbi:mannose-6-phosphate isomerase-like protein (cupin superfamily) [Spirosoma lacussanchae]|uniref:hypothetical protein n=1 Tax=Spirosoma lacussanchae TaxID=1884249 RepID=UPI001109809D|nr:hypothetical protein [Spirosoma lacussanchae]
MRITQHDGIYGETTARAGGEYLFSELIVTRSRTFDWIIQPHIHARLLQVFLVLSGRAEFKDASQQREDVPGYREGANYVLFRYNEGISY